MISEEIVTDDGRRSPETCPGSDDRVRVLVALDADVLRLGLCSLLKTLPMTRHVEGRGCWEKAVDTLKTTPYDLVIASAKLADEQLRQLSRRARNTDTKLLLLLGHASRETLSQAAVQLADGFLVEAELTRAALNDALARLQAGQLVVPPELTRELLFAARTRITIPQQRIYLTPREKQALRLLAEGLSNRQIAARMVISEHGAKRHVANVLAKLNCRNRTLAVAEALRRGLLGEPV